VSRIAEEFRFLWRTFLRGGRRAFLGVSAVVFAWVLLALSAVVLAFAYVRRYRERTAARA
jgi:hypothetical protein